MLRQDELAFIKAIASLQVSLALLRELRSALASRKKKKKTAMAAGSRSAAGGGGPKASSQLAGKRKANELLSSGDSMDPTNRRPAPDTGSVLLPASLSVTGEQAAISSQQLGPSEGGASMRPYWLETSPRSSQVGRSSPQPWIRTRPNPLSQRRQQTGAYLATCLAL
jgi:hypothetical protein